MKNVRVVKISVVLVFLASIGLFFILEHTGGLMGQTFTFMSVGEFIEFDANSRASFHVPTDARGRQTGFFLTTRDGFSFRNREGRVVFSESFSMQNPVMNTAGGIAAVAEQGGNEVFVFNTEGLMYSRAFQGPIITFSVNETGFLSVVSKRADVYESYVFNPNGHLVLENDKSRNTIISTAISPDGRIWALTSLDVSGALFNSYITFRFLNHAEGREHTDSAFGTIFGENIPELNNQFFGITRFMDGNNLIVLTNNSLFAIDMVRPQEPRWVIPLNNEIDHVSFQGDLIALAKGRSLLNMPGEPVGTVAVYNLNGNRVFEHQSPGRVTSLNLSSAGLIIGNGHTFTGLNPRGQYLWTYEAEHGARGIVFMENSDTILLHSGTRASVMNRVGVN